MSPQKEKDMIELFNEMSLLNFEIGSHFYAKPTFLVDPHDFYLIPFSFIFHLPFLSKPGDPIKPEDLKEGMIVVYESKNPDVNTYFKIELDEYIRGVIQRVDKNQNCQIFALDRGFIEKDVALDRIYYPKHMQTISVPSLIQHCELVSCAPVGDNFSKQAIEAFKFYIGNEKLSVVIHGKNGSKLKIAVYNSNPDDIATLLALTHYTLLMATIKNDLDNIIVKYSRQKLHYEHIKVSVNDVLTVRVQSGSSLKSFYVSPVSAYEEYLNNRANFTNHCKYLQEISDKDFRENMTVGVQDDVSLFYERAVILKVLVSDKAKVKLVDWGTELIVPRVRVKAIKTDFFLNPPVNVLYCCAVDGFVPWDNGLPKFLYKGHIFCIKIKEVGNGFDVPHTVALARA